MMFTTLAGVNIPKLLLDLIAGKELALPKRRELTILRYYEEIIVDAGAR
jgi:hypothetical protein